MPHFDFSGDQLRQYRPDLDVPDDLDAFWTATLAASPASEPEFTPVDNGLSLIDTFDVAYAGFDGSPVKGWLNLPAGAGTGTGTSAATGAGSSGGPLPTVVQFRGYGGGRGLAHQWLMWASAGYATLIMDTRGQGSASGVGHTNDPGSAGEPAHPGFMTQGIGDPESYYYRRVFTDAVRAVDAAMAHPLVDADQLAVAGASQGGGIALAVAGLHPQVRYALIDVPFLCDFGRATSITPKDPYTEIVRYLKVHRDHVGHAFKTLSYFDGAVLGRQATADALFSVALMDEICPPSTVYAAYNWYGGGKDIIEYPYNNHEGGQAHHDGARLRWLNKRVTFPA